MYIRNWKSDFHRFTAVSLQSQILKAPPKQKLYRDYKVFVKISSIMIYNQN